MKCAFKVHMPQQQSDDSESEEENLDDEHLWEDMNLVEDIELPWSSGERLSCFAHSLQLIVNDGMKEVRAISRTIAKTSRFTTLLHSSSQFKEKFKAMFDSNKTIPAANTTRWNSTFKQVQALTALDHKSLNEMCSKDYENVMFSACEWNQLKERVWFLRFLLHSLRQQTRQKGINQLPVTISMVVPTVLNLNTHLLKMEDTRMQFRPLVKALRQSLFGLSWVDLDVNNGGNATSVKKLRDELKKTLTDTLISELEKISSEGEATDSEAMNVDPP
ncbi:zinc finger BED domain-containing protein 4-like [Tachysurus ichikawai]